MVVVASDAAPGRRRARVRAARARAVPGGRGAPDGSAAAGDARALVRPLAAASGPPTRRSDRSTDAAGPPAPPDGAAAAARTRPAPDDLRLNAISQRDGQPVALVNDRLVREGDSFDGVRVLRIGEAEVEVEVRGQRRVLRF